jgi:hypothetical protein
MEQAHSFANTLSFLLLFGCMVFFGLLVAVSFITYFVVNSLASSRFRAYCLLLNMPLCAIRQITVSLLEEGQSDWQEEDQMEGSGGTGSRSMQSTDMSKSSSLFDIDSVKKRDSPESGKLTPKSSVAKLEQVEKDERGRRSYGIKRPSPLHIVDSSDENELDEGSIGSGPASSKVGMVSLGSSRTLTASLLSESTFSHQIISPSYTNTELISIPLSPRSLEQKTLSLTSLDVESNEAPTIASEAPNLVVHAPVLLESDAEYATAHYEEVVHRTRKNRRPSSPGSPSIISPCVSPGTSSPHLMSPILLSPLSPAALPGPPVFRTGSDAAEKEFRNALFFFCF